MTAFALYRRFDPTNLNADQLVHVAGNAGMKCMVLKAKHADGFLLSLNLVTEQHIRLKILDGSEGPAGSEIKLSE
jgi:Alpha-L-fucosidase